MATKTGDYVCNLCCYVRSIESLDIDLCLSLVRSSGGKP